MVLNNEITVNEGMIEPSNAKKLKEEDDDPKSQ